MMIPCSGSVYISFVCETATWQLIKFIISCLWNMVWR